MTREWDGRPDERHVGCLIDTEYLTEGCVPVRAKANGHCPVNDMGSGGYQRRRQQETRFRTALPEQVLASILMTPLTSLWYRPWNVGSAAVLGGAEVVGGAVVARGAEVVEDAWSVVGTGLFQHDGTDVPLCRVVAIATAAVQCNGDAGHGR